MREIDNYAPELLRFLKQANEPTPNLETKSYKGVYNDCEVDVSFGRGNLAHIPWIAFLREGQKVSNGIYPVYLYYKEHNILILAYGISETTPPALNWDVKDVKEMPIRDFFWARFGEAPERYGDSLLFNSYQIDTTRDDYGLDFGKINEEILYLTEFYKTIDFGSTVSPKEESLSPKNIKISSSASFDYNRFVSDIKAAHLSFSERLIFRFVTALCAKPFVILTGLSGSGKTKLAQAFAKWICEEKDQICMVPVGADWTSREPLLGYPNALERDRYVFPDNGALALILKASANKNRNKPYFLILDEMNLSHVERYFADFLSAMESSEEICLHPGTQSWNGERNLPVPPSITLPPNLFIIGTVNIDETTYMFSPKVLDRANVIEFRVSKGEMDSYLNAVNGRLDLLSLHGNGAEMAEDFVRLASENALSLHKEKLSTLLLEFFDPLKKASAEFGYRSAGEMIRFAAIAAKIDPTLSLNMNFIVDCIIMQKMLPKVHGARRKLEDILEELGQLCIHEEKDVRDKKNVIKKEGVIKLFDAREITDNHEGIKYSISFEKIKRMYQGLMNNAFTSYAEA
ncbi:DUF3578 domain-containing protein [Chitinophaga agrisoli]|uniref:DUF3578 domain-containing protein n=1 Tax=Chitinophaga agrisoli TaxID=2607653 RepID=A0A5B2VNU7_9BACT|nr:DUF3578 domain-containing protein [Chitinophaga agrisoli]KAA2240056.1 DUF3578 domain-containing protein [Chitinophaga agrisoli]